MGMVAASHEKSGGEERMESVQQRPHRESVVGKQGHTGRSLGEILGSGVSCCMIYWWACLDSVMEPQPKGNLSDGQFSVVSSCVYLLLVLFHSSSSVLKVGRLVLIY